VPWPALSDRRILRSRSLRVGLLHLAPETGALEQNRALIENATAVAADMGAAWVVSGELVVPGYRFQPLIGTDWITRQPAECLLEIRSLH
jgi:predicted amidohydrolase